MSKVANNSDRIVRLNKYLDHMKQKRTMIPERHLSNKERYLEFIDLEIKRTKLDLEQLKMGS